MAIPCHTMLEKFTGGELLRIVGNGVGRSANQQHKGHTGSHQRR